MNTVTIVVIVGDSEWMDPYLVDVPASASKREMEEAIYAEVSLDNVDLEEAQVFELEPLAAERLKDLEWQETFCDADAFSQNMHKAIVYAAFAKGGPVKLECLEEE